MTKQDKEEELWGDIKINKYLQDSCYKGFNDDAKSFFSVYRDLFEKLKCLEEEVAYFYDSNL